MNLECDGAMILSQEMMNPPAPTQNEIVSQVGKQTISRRTELETNDQNGEIKFDMADQEDDG